ncbi:MAG TPA: hypothetical protein VMH33_11670 [Solirubrobacterales bacterium]|nr:hypothetical protein [Solirubrobacterales bacterium]
MAIGMIGDAGYKIALFFHILAVAALGATFAYGILFSVLPKYPRAAPALIDGMRRVDRYMINPAMIVLLIAGIVLLATSGSVWKGSQFFVVWGFIAIIALFGLQHGFFGPQMAQLQEDAERDLASGDTFGAEFEARSQRIAQVGGAAGLLIVVTIFIMVYKPFL